MAPFIRRFSRNSSAVLGAFILVVVALIALIGPLFYAQDPFHLVGTPFSPPFQEHALGTDILGRDVATGIVYGARTSLLIGLFATAIAVLLGTVLGAVAGYYGGRANQWIMRITEIFQTIPFFLFAILLVAILGASITNVVLAIAIVSWPPMTRLVRGEFLAARGKEYVEACMVMGMSNWRTIVHHILPNTLSSIIVMSSLMVANAILIESALSFLGLGDPNVMSWGFMIGAARPVLRTAWWLCAFPGIAILVTVLAINLVGEGLNDALNPRLRHF